MKRILLLILAALLLAGCGAEVPAPTDPTTQTQPPTEPPAPELVLDTWELPEEAVDAVPMGSDILLFCRTGNTRLVKLKGKNKEVITSADLKCYIYPQSPAVAVSDEGLCYFDGAAMVYLDAGLNEVERIPLPETALSEPAVSADGATIYYPTADSIRVIDRDTRIDRLLREVSFPHLSINGLHLGDTVLEYVAFDDNYNAAAQYISTATGELLREYPGGLALWSSEDFWFAAISRDNHTTHLFGAAEGQANALNIAPDFLEFVPTLNAILTARYDDCATTLAVFDLETGAQTAELTMEGTAALSGIWADAEKAHIWFLLDGKTLCRWNLSKSAVSDGVSCIGPYYTREEPDVESLAALTQRADALGEAYGVRIHIWEDAVAQMPEDYAFSSEYRVDVLTTGLDALETAMARLPEGFLASTGKVSKDNRVHICLVQSVNGILDTAEGVQFWDENGAARIALTAHTNVERNFYHELSHVIDTRVMNECSAYDGWDKLNPKGFKYDYDYVANRDRDGTAYAHAFIDTYAMSFPTEDRARIFEYAMTEGHADRFSSETMQKKLATLCAGIRKAYRLDSEAPLPWEQYLT